MPRAKKNIIPITIQTESTGATNNQEAVMKIERKKSTRKKKAYQIVVPGVHTEIVHPEPAHTDDVYKELKKASVFPNVESVHNVSRSSRMPLLGKYFPVLVLGICVILIGLVYMNKSKVYALLDTMYLIPRKETFTELYLNEYPKIPARLLFAKQVYPFTFTIRNIEGTRT